MTDWTWTAEPTPVWDADKAAAFSPAGPGLHGLGSPSEGDALGDAWWRIGTADGEVAGFGRLDDTWGDAEVLVAVVPAFRGHGVGSWAMNRLAEEAAARSLKYVYNVVPVKHPDREGVQAWLAAQGFDARDTGELRRRVRVTDTAVTPSSS